jgi:hypothetical protein
MTRQRIILNNEHSVGLGDNLCLLSALATIPPDTDLYTTNEHKTFDRLTLYKTIFRIPDNKLTIHLADEDGMFNNVGWPIKLFSDYYKPPYVNISGQVFKTAENLENKKCIGLVCSFDEPGVNTTEWPWTRSRPKEYWARMFSFIKSMGYEVITIDNPYFDLETKIELMVKHCKAVIGYEGGMAHLSHMLQIPYFMVPWRFPTASTTLGQFHCEFVHRTNTVHMMRTDDELFYLGQDQFNQRIAELLRGQTNNRIFNGECKIKFKGPGIHGKVSVEDKHGCPMLPPVGGIFGDNQSGWMLNKWYPQY